ncbi:phosphoribosyltransferase domain-containing protein [Psychrobacter sp.]|uniref:phosphoribosyltransferase domain-containing protein n=1 Tax=Psychrobacter sp. TaxID=56811 RepID=UPI0025F7D274|nr:phosphoribosyltransferase domain-containing protein [Psychrobacter sp.]
MTIDSTSTLNCSQSYQQKQVQLPRGTLNLSYQLNGEHRYQLDDLLGFAQRINPKRAFLFVSKVLGRHIPVSPKVMRQAFTHLADAVPDNLPEPIVVLGMAETAVGLSAGVHQALQSRYPNALLLNSTRHAQQQATLYATFNEDHSHASTHLIYQSQDPKIQTQLLASKTLIMVDDEASTGNTCVNVVSALREAGLKQLQQVHLATLVDWSLGQQTSDDHIAERLQGIKFKRHNLMAGDWQWTDAPNPEPIDMPSVDTTEAGSQPLLHTGNWGRLPTFDSTEGFAKFLESFKNTYEKVRGVNALSDLFGSGLSDVKAVSDVSNTESKRILVLGSNEFVWLPFLLAEWLEQQVIDNVKRDIEVNFSALTRSPIALGGAIKAVLSFNDNYGLGMTNFAYNVVADQWDLIVLCVETPTESVDPLWHNLDNVIVVSP